MKKPMPLKPKVSNAIKNTKGSSLKFVDEFYKKTN